MQIERACDVQKRTQTVHRICTERGQNMHRMYTERSPNACKLCATLISIQ